MRLSISVPAVYSLSPHVTALIAAVFVGLLRISATASGRWIRWGLCALVLGGAAYQLALIGRDVVTGDGSSARLVVPMRYPALRVPASDAAARLDAADRLAGDFAQVYFPARDERPIARAYDPYTTADPWNRASRFAPLVHFACMASVCALPYGWASLVHLLFQIGLLAYSVVRAWRLLGLPRDQLTAGLVLIGACLFLSPVGLSWFERGQWSVYVGLGYLWLLLGLILDRPRYVVAAAVLAFLKWTALPSVFVILSVHVLAGDSIAECRRRSRPALLFAATFAALVVCTPAASVAFVRGLGFQELVVRPMGLSLVAFLTRPVVKLLPVVLVAIGVACLRARRRTDPALLPFAAGAAVILLGYPTVAYDYSVPSLMGFVPLVAYWAQAGRVSPRLGALTRDGFFLFLVLASFSMEVFGRVPDVLTAYAVATGALVLAAAARAPEYEARVASA